MNLLEAKIRNYLSALFPLLILLLAWPRIYFYEFQIFKLAIITFACGLYFVHRISQKGKWVISKRWWLAASVIGYFLLSLSISPNMDIGVARFVLLISFFLLFFLALDALSTLLNRDVVLEAFIIFVGMMMLLAVVDVFRAYQKWWEVFRYGGELPPFAYRIGITMHANHWLALMNLFVPIVGVLLFISHDKTKKWLSGFWLVLYLFVAYFSSSRGGYVAVIAGLGILLLILLDWKSIIFKFKKLNKSHRLVVIVGLIILLTIAGFIFYRYFIQSSSHPSHGSETGGLNLNRLGIWTVFLNEWLASPIFGVGIGRSVFGLFSTNQTIPPGWLPIHSHNMPLGILAEFGVLGTLLIGALVILTIIRIARLFYVKPRSDRYLTGGVIAGVSTMVFHSLFDDFTLEPVVLVCAIVLIAWLLSVEDGMVEKDRVSISVIWLGIFASAVAIVAFWYLAPTKYLSSATLSRESTNEQNVVEQAKLVERAIDDRPNSHYFISQGAMFWMEAWEENQADDEIARAEELAAAALEIEPAESFQWMNLAAINWAQGDFEDSLSNAGQAILLAPSEPVYYLNLGWYYESLGEHGSATKNYLFALQNSEQLGWATHPFWQQNELRKSALEDYLSENPERVIDSPLDEFWNAYKAGDIALARKIYTRVEWEKAYGNPPLASLLGGLLAIYERDISKAFTLIEESYKSVYMPTRLSPLSDWKRFYYRTSGIGWPFVPGVLQLSQDFGQFDLYEEILPLLEEHLTSEQLCELEKEYTLAVSGGQLWQDGVFIPSICD